jgi:hypothetical protein
MKIVIVGESVYGGWADTFLRAFNRVGVGVVVYDDRKVFNKKIPLATNRYMYRLFWKPMALVMQKRFKKDMESLSPDLVLIFKGFLWSPNTLKKLKKTLPRTLFFNFNSDNPENTWHHGNSSSWIRSSIPLYDCYLIWSKQIVERLKDLGAINPKYLACGYDKDLHYPVKLESQELKLFGSDLSFVGSWDEEREEWISNLLDYDIKIWGNSWEKASSKIQARWQRKEMVGEDFSRVCAASKINLNFLRKQNLDSHNMRTFEIPACAGFMMSRRSSEQQGFFEEGKEADYFSTPEELKKKIDFYLKNESLRKKIAGAGYEKLLKSKYSYDDRAEEILAIYKNLSEMKKG